MRTVAGVVAAVIALPLIVVVLLTGGACGARASTLPRVSVGTVSAQVPGFDQEQLVNAAHIMNVASEMSLNSRAHIIGVMTAIGESSLINIDYGDWETNGVRNPDGSPTTSIGLFQQQDGWGPVPTRMDPSGSARLFYDALVKVDGWENLEPTIAAHRVQRNADPNHYAKFHDQAVAIVSALADADITLDAEASGACAAGASGDFAPANGTPPGPWGGYANGRMPVSILTPIPWRNIGPIHLRSDAATSLIALNNQFRAEFGYNLPLNDGYRSYEQQVQAKIIYGGNAATPGTSNHGWALAIDIGDRNHRVLTFSGPIYQWLNVHAGRYGWVNPEWARPGGAGPDEAWHWEYYGVGS